MDQTIQAAPPGKGRKKIADKTKWKREIAKRERYVDNFRFFHMHLFFST